MYSRLLFIIIIQLLCININGLEAPNGLKVTFIEPLGLNVEWELNSKLVDTGITGYKIYMWEIGQETTRNYKLLNGEQYPGFEENNMSQEPFEKDYVPKADPKVFDVKSEYVTYLLVKQISMKILYEIRIAAVKGTETGAMSDPLRVKAMLRDNSKVILAKRSIDYCETSVLTGLGSHAEDAENYSDTNVYNTFL